MQKYFGNRAFLPFTLFINSLHTLQSPFLLTFINKAKILEPDLYICNQQWKY